jgi:hypothetical protein
MASRENRPSGDRDPGPECSKGEIEMKSVVVLPIALLFIATLASAQSDAQKSPAPSQAQKSFDQLKTLAGSWEGPVTVQPPQPDMHDNTPTQVTLRVTSMGNLLVHEVKSSARPDDPITTIYLDNDRLTLTHYCDAGNRPRMVGKMWPDGKTVEFEFVDIAGDTRYGHMDHAVFTPIDANHHIEDWTFIINTKNGPTPVHAHFDLHRKS